MGSEMCIRDRFGGLRTTLDYSIRRTDDPNVSDILLFWDPLDLSFITSWEIDGIPDGITAPQSSGCTISADDATVLLCNREISDFTLSQMGSGNFTVRVRGIYTNPSDEPVRVALDDVVVNIPAMATVHTSWSIPKTVYYTGGGDLEIDLDVVPPPQDFSTCGIPQIEDAVVEILAVMSLPASSARPVISTLWIIASVGVLVVFIATSQRGGLGGVALGGAVATTIWLGGPFLVCVPWAETAACWGLLAGLALVTVYRKMR